MMEDLKQADVVITNPTHFAVALKYDQSKHPAPYVVAKGQDEIALRIKAIAQENNIVLMENKPLARTLYAQVELGQAVPPELYKAVAEVLAFVYRLNKRKKHYSA
jgi:flagellar biosynthetic protein FlhB